jgi:hypothetical protein
VNASYITSSAGTTRRKSAFLQILVATFLAVFIGLSGALAATAKSSRTAEASDVIQWAMCYFGEDSIPGQIYQNTQTSDLQFLLRSKSSITSGVDDVDSGLNAILDIFGPGFKKVNESITGYSIEPFDPAKASGDSSPAKENFNKGVKVNPFDRFGVAGLNFTAYTGEWKHVVIDACSTASSTPQDPKAGVFYEGRLEARSTWEDIGNSADIRTKQFGKGFGTQFGISMADIFANGIFTITKTIVVVTIGLINFAFGDIVEVTGLNKLIAGGPEGGIFGLLFNGIFTPLIVIVFAVTGGYIFWHGIVKRQYRSSMTALIRSLALFIIAIIISANPLAFITLPNKIAVTGQAIILTAMNSGLSGGNGLCSTDIGQFKTKLVNNPDGEAQDILTEASESIRSAVGCQFWQTFLLKPWAEGQFGTSWNKLYAKGKIPDWAPSSTSAALTNGNESMVGDAAVPMGNGSIINNWALFQISTETNAHSPIGHPGERSKYTSGVANDWWRIVDTFANYQEEQAKMDATGSGPYGTTNSVEYTKVKATPVLNNWDTWVGNTAYNRMWTASSSVIVAGIGLAAPLFFAFLSAIYSVGMALMMAFAPIMLLLGCWAGRGWEIFKGWGELVINTTLKRIATGALLSVAIGLEAAAIQMMDTVGWWQGILMLILVSVIIIKSRAKIIDALASIRFASTNFSATASKINDKTIGTVKKTGKFATSSVAAGINSKRYGGKISDGMLAGAKNELRNLSYQSPSLRNVMTSYEANRTEHGYEFDGQQSCSTCGKMMDDEADQFGTGVILAGRTLDGNIICYECYEDGVDPDAVEYRIERPDSDAKRKEARDAEAEKLENKTRLHDQQDKIRGMRFRGKTAFGNTANVAIVDQLAAGVDRDGNSLTKELANKKFRSLMGAIKYDIQNHRNEGIMPAIPVEIQESMNHELLKEAWQTKNYVWIQQAYIAAWAQWFAETTGFAITSTLDELVARLEENQNPKNNNK